MPTSALQGVQKVEREGDLNRFQEIMAENLTDVKMYRIIEVSNKMNQNRPILRHVNIIIKLAKVKGKILKAAREKASVTRNPHSTCQLISH